MKALSVGKLKQVFKKKDKVLKLKIEAMMARRRKLSKKNVHTVGERREMITEIKKIRGDYEKEKKELFENAEERAKEEEMKVDDK